MAAIKTDSNQPVELDYAELIKRLDHIDVMLHEITQFIAEHKPALDRGMALLDPGAKLRGLMPGKNRGR